MHPPPPALPRGVTRPWGPPPTGGRETSPPCPAGSTLERPLGSPGLFTSHTKIGDVRHHPPRPLPEPPLPLPRLPRPLSGTPPSSRPGPLRPLPRRWYKNKGASKSRAGRVGVEAPVAGAGGGGLSWHQPRGPPRGGRGGEPSVTVRAHRRGAFPFPLGRFGLGVFLLLRRERGRGGHRLTGRGGPPGQGAVMGGAVRGWGVGGGLTEALLEADSSSLLAGCAAFLRLRGLETVALRRLLGGLLEESSYSSAREKRSLNLEGGAAGRSGAGWGAPLGRPCGEGAPLTSSCGLRRSWPGRAAAPAGWASG